MATKTRRPANERLADAQTAEAWDEYLETCRKTSEVAYDEVEEWAWERLRSRLQTIRRSERRAA